MKTLTLKSQSRDDTWIWLLVFGLSMLAALVSAAYLCALVLKLGNPARIFYEDKRAFFEVSWVLMGVVLIGLAVYTYRRIIESYALSAKLSTAELLERLGARAVLRDPREPRTLRLLNITEEIAIACGRNSPAVYVMDDEDGINAFTAGTSLGDTAICVTGGALRLLKRAELQAVIAHEYGHIVSGDVSRNMGLLHCLAAIVPNHGQGAGWRTALVLAFVALGFGLLACVASGAQHETIQIFAAWVGAIAFLWLIMLLPAKVMRKVWIACATSARLAHAAFARRRELEADAVAVQMTRDPGALAGALRKIGGLRDLAHLHADQAAVVAHMCIAPALAGWSEGAFSAHPPLAKRLAHLGYPLTPDEKSRFDEYDPSVMPRYSAEVNEELGIMQFHRPTRAAEVKRNPPRADGHRLAPPEATAQARSFTLDEALNAEPDLDSAVLLLAELPQPLREALRTEEGARAAAHALLNGKVQTYGELARRYSIFLAAQGDVWRLPLFELAAPALRAMSSVSRQALATELHGVVHAYGTMTMHELVFYLLLTKLLDTAPRKTSIQPAEDAAATVLAAAAYEFAPDPAQTQAAFDAGVRQTPYALKLPARAEVTTASLELALDRLSQIADLAKPHITRGVAAVVCHDGEINAREIEFVRAVGAALDCPIPPLAITKIKPPKAPA